MWPPKQGSNPRLPEAEHRNHCDTAAARTTNVPDTSYIGEAAAQLKVYLNEERQWASTRKTNLISEAFTPQTPPNTAMHAAVRGTRDYLSHIKAKKTKKKDVNYRADC